jgi:hypothetical protein
MLASKDSNGHNLPIPAAPGRGTAYFAGRLEDWVDWQIRKDDPLWYSRCIFVDLLTIQNILFSVSDNVDTCCISAHFRDKGEIRQRQFADEEPRHLLVGEFDTEYSEEDSNPSSAAPSSLFPDETLTPVPYPEYQETTIFASIWIFEVCALRLLPSFVFCRVLSLKKKVNSCWSRQRRLALAARGWLSLFSGARFSLVLFPYLLRNFCPDRPRIGYFWSLCFFRTYKQYNKSVGQVLFSLPKLPTNKR